MFQAYQSLDDVPADIGPCVLTVGNFDGVHRGHQRILIEAVEIARSEGWRSVALTFDPHPTKVVAPERAPVLLSSMGQRLERFEQIGVDAALVMPFTQALAALSPEDFVSQIVVERLGARAVVVGSNFRFGRRHAGDVATLVELGRHYGFSGRAVEPLEIEGEVVSSTRVRNAVLEGRMERANRLLGEKFRLWGTVVRGRGVGRNLNAPTLNIEPDSELLPADGVYVTQTLDLATGELWRSVTNVGVRPTFDLAERAVETHLISEFDGQRLERIEVRFLKRLREERKFDSPDELRDQIMTDVAQAERLFSLHETVAADG